VHSSRQSIQLAAAIRKRLKMRNQEFRTPTNRRVLRTVRFTRLNRTATPFA
jgi:hypothetical protein